MSSYQAWQVAQKEDGSFWGHEETLNTDDLPHGSGILIKVSHSSLNYKDALSANGNKGVTRKFPHTPGIDAVGRRVDDDSPVLVTGYDLGMNTNGGFGEYIKVPEEWIASVPFANPRVSMIYGTAGLTAGLCVQKLRKIGATPQDGKVVITGATGSVGSVAVELLTMLGFDVVAISGKAPKHLLELGAKEVLPRSALEATKKPLVKPLFAHAIDTVGGRPLAELLKQIQPGGSVVCCGMVTGVGLETTVLPFILRGINLLGVDSVEIPLSEKQAIWDLLAGDWACPKTEASAKYIGRHQLDKYLSAFLEGKSSGKIVLDHSLTQSKI
eukprot:CAMPEP_0183307346 /NCGR_PEP_ID=MMETSP0160_2-20130417/17275_1 /TAXON_ID=2839 ORGANISM="Odontella Sinensis, Strain Grunow 1884" /NCGR_SAMPLE_ID=MMETSP0160_2 /ASSEMBLY_ACC=CAM_ASM_000250 /LENGTH=326 /DNA_ID=CAMNT_0025470915 /DNA_START=120 /DNA_END=1100 /DNA_ORIENTATION=+